MLYVIITAILEMSGNMEYLLLYLMSVLITVGGEVAIAFKMIKEIADQGYKFNLERLKEFSDMSTLYKYIFLVPILNIVFLMVAKYEYDSYGFIMLDQFRVLDMLEKMDKEEQEVYNKHPNAITAIAIEEIVSSLKELEHKKEVKNELPINTLRIDDISEIKFTIDQDANIKIIELSKDLEKGNINEASLKVFIYKKLGETLRTAKEKTVFENYQDLKKDNINVKIESNKKDNSLLEEIKETKELLYELRKYCSGSININVDLKNTQTEDINNKEYIKK